MHFSMKNTLKSNHNHTLKQALNYKHTRISYQVIFFFQKLIGYKGYFDVFFYIKNLKCKLKSPCKI